MRKIFNRAHKEHMFLAVLIVFFFLGGAWYIIHGDITYVSDIARDFLVFEEIAVKKLVLLGPRASGMPGMFHGPLWEYLNFPAYLLGKGNPVAVGWFWVVLSGIYVFSITILVQKIFGIRAGLITGVIASAQMVGYTQQLFNPYGALFLFPLLWYCAYEYIIHRKFVHAVLLWFVIGAMIQFQMAVGVPMAILCFFPSLLLWKRHKLWGHSVSILAVIPFMLSWLLFDIRHAGQLTSALIHYFTVKDPGRVFYSLFELMNMRSSVLFSRAFRIFPTVYDGLNTFAAVSVAIVFFVEHTHWRKEKVIAWYTALYLYVGYFVISLAHNGWLMEHYYLPLVPVAIILFASVLDASKNKILWGVAIVALIVNISVTYKFMSDARYNINWNKTSWQVYNNMASNLLTKAKGDYGYFIYAPDVLGYQLKYAFSYNEKRLGISNVRNQKAKVTYVVAEPAPKSEPGLSVTWWIENKLKITSPPFSTTRLANDHMLYEYHLTNEEISQSHDPDIDEWLHYR